MARQLLPEVYEANGAIYIRSRKGFLDTGTLMGSRVGKFLMSAEKSVDIDTLDDLQQAKSLLERNLSNFSKKDT